MINIELLKIELLIVVLPTLIMIFAFWCLFHAQNKDGKSYIVENGGIHIYKIPNRHISFLDIEEVTVGHSWRELFSAGGVEYQWTVWVKYRVNKRICFTIGYRDDPNYIRSRKKCRILYSDSNIRSADKAKDYFIQILESKGINYKMKK